CRCREGYTGNPEIGCRDINECEKSDFFCGSKATCVNEVGGHRCECLEGYEKLGSVCTDINECLHNPCDPAALCTNVEGTFKCDCIDGFVGNGIECHETILFPANGASPVSNAPVALDNPLTIFGNKYDKLYISDNGVISFDRSFYGPISDISEIRSNALFPFYRQNSPASVTFIEISESDASRYSLLTRASLTAQNKFKQTDFRAKTLYITTFKDDTGFAYQVVIAQSKNATYVTFLYEKIETTNGVTTGISSNNGFFNIPTELLSHNSNIGQRGKW
uniref:EGF-like domain-containing protein n=1 Tax=Panagrolaimus sp. PS1159 TaxID=55785 RepID=A0AC35EUR6_9BILA